MFDSLRKLLSFFDLNITRPSYTPLNALFERLNRHGIIIQEVWDVGAFKGEWTLEVAKYLPNAKFTLFEPNSSHNSDLARANSRVFNIVLSDKDEKRRFYSHEGTGDSLYPEFDERSKVRKSFRIETCHRIDTLLSRDLNLVTPDFLKLDVQGSELDVLRGVGSHIYEIKVILLECPILHYNWGSPNIQDYLSFLFRSGFVPYFVTEIHRLNEIVTQIDLAFVEKTIFNARIKPLSESGFWFSTEKKYPSFIIPKSFRR
jgi:FkbM family methyltransferase